jgi:hypothetical protein
VKREGLRRREMRVGGAGKLDTKTERHIRRLGVQEKKRVREE